MVQQLITNEMAALMVFLVSLVIALSFDLIKTGGKKPLTYRPSGIPQRIDLFDAKNLPITEAVEDRNRGMIIAKTPQLKHRLYIPMGLIEQPASMGAYLAGDVRRRNIKLPMDCAGRHVPWTGEGFPMLKQEQRVLDLQRQNYLLSERMQKVQEPVDNQVDNVFSRLREASDIVGSMMSSSKEATEPKRRF